MKRALLAVALAAAALPASARAWDFRTPDGAIHCRLGIPQDRLAFGCVRRADGRWIGFSGYGFRRPRPWTGIRTAYRTARDQRAFVLTRGRSWSSSDASAFTCWHFRRGVTCKTYAGPSFWLGSTRGYRFFRDKPGFVPHVRPLFRTSFGVRCGIELWTLEPSVPTLRCWRARDGRELSLSIVGRGSTRSWPKSEGFRPRGFELLGAGETSAWRCRRFQRTWAENCSPTRGTPVFTCRVVTRRLTCRNPAGGSFWATATRFGSA